MKAIIIACNTASAVALQSVQNFAGHVPVFDVIRPAVQELLLHTVNAKVGVIATKTTIHSGVYGQQLKAERADLKVTEKATPLLVPMIEEGWVHNRVSQDVIDAYMSDTGFHEIDALILGCTHYPLIKRQIEAYFLQNYQHQVHVVDSSEAVAMYVKKALVEMNLLNEEKSPAGHRYFFIRLFRFTFRRQPKYSSIRKLLLRKKNYRLFDIFVNTFAI